MPTPSRMLRIAAAALGAALLVVGLRADAVTAGSMPGAAARLIDEADAPDTPARLSALLALTAREMGGTTGPDRVLARSMDRFAHVRRAFGASAGIAGAVATADQSLIFSAHEDGYVRSWDAPTGRERGSGYFGGAAIGLLVFDPVHRLLASSDQGGGVQLWQVGPAGEISPPVIAQDSGTPVTGGQLPLALDFYAAGTRLVLTGGDGSITVWGVTWHEGVLFDLSYPIRVVPDYPSSTRRWFGDDPDIVAASAVLPGSGGRAARIVAALDDGDVVSVDLPGTPFPQAAQEPRAVQLIPGRALPATVRAVAVGRGQLALGTDGGVLVWDLGRARRVAYPAAGLSFPTNGTLTYTASGSWLLIGGDGGLYAVPAGDYQRDAVVPVYQPGVVAAAAGPESAVLATADGMICVVDVAADALLRPTDGSSWTADFTTGGALVAEDDDGLYEVSEPARRYGPYLPGRLDFQDVVTAPGFVAAAGLTGSGQGAVLVWTGPGPAAHTLPFAARDGHYAAVPVARLRYLPDRDLLVARNQGGEVAAWSTRTWAQQFRLLPGYGFDLLYDQAHGRLLAPVVTGAADGSPEAAGRTEWVAIDLAAGRIAEQRSPAPAIYRLAQAADGGDAAILRIDNRLLLIDSAGNVRGAPIALPAFGSALALSPDGERLAVATDDGRIIVFDARRGTALYALPASRLAPGLLHAERLRWDRTGRRLAVVLGTVWRREFRPDRHVVVVADPAAWAARLCEILAPGLTAEEWDRHVGSRLPRRDPCDGSR
jgi:WD40 repeat protein